MTTELLAYRSALLLALRLREVPGPRIAEALAEVDSHVAETGEDPEAAFGPASTYAEQLSKALQPTTAHGWRRWLTGFTGAPALIALLSLSGCWLLADGLFSLGARRASSLGLGAFTVILLGAGLLVVMLRLILRSVREHADPVVDPRDGTDLAPPVPRWAIVLLGAVAVLIPAQSYVLGVLAR